MTETTIERWKVDRRNGWDGDGEGPRIPVRLGRCDGCDVLGVVCTTPDGGVEWDGGRIAELGEAIATDPRHLVVLCAGRHDGTELHRTLCDGCAA